MKKSALFLACCIGLMLFASCKKDPVAPTIDIQKGEGFVYENAQVYSGDEIMVGFYCTGESLTKIEIVVSQNGTILDSYIDDCTSQKNDPVPPYLCKHSFTIEATGTVNIKGTVTDANGLTASKSFNINYNEKPNTKFLGHYEGDALFTGIMKAEITGIDPVEQEVTDRAVPVILELRDGETMTEVIGNCKINDQDMEIKGTVEGNKVTFEAVNTTVSYNYDMNGFNIPLEMNVTYAVTGTLENETLTLNGTCNGEGEIQFFLYNGTTSIDGTIGGSLVKQ
jgi:hypothetical protein